MKDGSFSKWTGLQGAVLLSLLQLGKILVSGHCNFFLRFATHCIILIHVTAVPFLMATALFEQFPNLSSIYFGFSAAPALNLAISGIYSILWHLLNQEEYVMLLPCLRTEPFTGMVDWNSLSLSPWIGHLIVILWCVPLLVSVRPSWAARALTTYSWASMTLVHFVYGYAWIDPLLKMMSVGLVAIGLTETFAESIKA